MVDIIERLREIIRQTEQKSLNISRKPISYPEYRPQRRALSIEEVIEGKYEDTHHGSCYVGEKKYLFDYHHGKFPLSIILRQSPQALISLGKDERFKNWDPYQAAFIDIETTGLAGGTGTYAFLVGVGFFEDDVFRIRQFFMKDFDEEPAMLSALNALLQRFRYVITYNGKCFDIPLLETRFITNRQRMNLTEFGHFDLLFPARRLWKRRIGDCSLGTVERIVASVDREGDIPSEMIPRMYIEYLRRSDARIMERVFYHNLQDILSLAILAGVVSEIFSNPFGGSVSHPDDFLSLARMYEDIQWFDLSHSCYEEAVSLEDVLHKKSGIIRRKGLLHKKQREWEKAYKCWYSVMRWEDKVFDPKISEEMAKFLEHRVRDYREAIRITEKAIEKLNNSRDFETLSLIESFNRRLRRLHCKLTNTRWY